MSDRVFSIVGAVVGAVIGAYVGGVSGAVEGFEIGYTIGSVVDSSNAKINVEGPRLSDTKFTFSSNGAWIPRIYVRAGGIGGNIVDSTDLEEVDVTTETSGKGGPTTVTNTPTYRASFRVRICLSNGDRNLSRIWANANLLWSRTTETDAVSVVASGATVGQIIVYQGAMDQMPDPTQEGMHGVGNVPAHRGYLDVMFVDFDLTKFSNNVEATQLTFEVVQKPATPTEKLVNVGAAPIIYRARRMWRYVAFTPGGGDVNVASLRVEEDVFDGSGFLTVGNFATSDEPLLEADPANPDNLVHAHAFEPTGTLIANPAFPNLPPLVWVFERSSHVEDIITGSDPPVVTPITIDDGDGSVNLYDPLGDFVSRIDVFLPIATYRAAWPISGGETSDHIVAVGPVGYAFSEIRPRTNLSGASGMAASWLKIAPSASAIPFTATYDDERIVGILLEARFAYILTISNDATTIANKQYKCHVIDCAPTDGSAPAELVVLQGPANILSSGLVPGFSAHLDMMNQGGQLVVISNGVARFKWDVSGLPSVIDSDATVLDMTSRLDQYGQTLIYTNDDNYLQYGVFSTLFGPDTDPSSPTFHYFPTILLTQLVDPDAGTPLSEVIEEIITTETAVENNSIAFINLPDEILCKGYIVTRQTSPRVAVDYLREPYRIDVSSAIYPIKFIRRGGDLTRTLSIDDLGAKAGNDGDAPDAVQFGDADPTTLSKAILLKYTRRDSANYDVGLAIARRETVAGQATVTLDATALMLSDQEAVDLAELALADAQLSGSTANFSTLYKHVDLEEADVVQIPDDFKPMRVRIQTKSDRGGMCDWTAVKDDADSLAPFAPASSGITAGHSVGVSPLSRVDILNLPMLRADDDEPGWYAFTYPTRNDGYPGADDYDSISTSPNKFATTSSGQKPRGFSITALPNYTGVAFDTGATIDVQFPSGVSLETVSRPDIYANKNIFLIGAEIVGVRKTTLISTADDGSTVWRLHGGILRGMRDTRGAISSHLVGELVYLLNTDTLRRNRTASTAGTAVKNITTGAVTKGRTTNDLAAFATTGTNTSQALVAFDPFRIGYGVTSDGGLLVHWNRRTRIPTTFLTTAPLGEPSESYRVDFSSTEDFANGRSFFVSSPRLRLSAVDVALLPAGYSIRVKMIESGSGTTPLTTGTGTGPIPTNPDLGPMPSDVPNLLFKLDPGAPLGATIEFVQTAPGVVGPQWEAFAIPDLGTVASFGTFISSPGIVDGRFQFPDPLQSQITAINQDSLVPQADRFNLGGLDWTFSIEAAISSRTFLPNPTFGNVDDKAKLLERTISNFDNLPGLWHWECTLINDGQGGQTRDSGIVSFYLPDFPSKILRTAPAMNDGVNRVYSVSRRGTSMYLGVNGRIVDQVDGVVGDLTDVAGYPSPKFGPIRGTMGVITITTS